MNCQKWHSDPCMTITTEQLQVISLHQDQNTGQDITTRHHLRVTDHTYQQKDIKMKISINDSSQWFYPLWCKSKPVSWNDAPTQRLASFDCFLLLLSRFDGVTFSCFFLTGFPVPFISLHKTEVKLWPRYVKRQCSYVNINAKPMFKKLIKH